MKADRVIGCVVCGKPCALVGDIIPHNRLCPWCLAEESPGVFALYEPKLSEVGSLIVDVAHRLRHFGFALLYLHQGEWRFVRNDLQEAEMAPDPRAGGRNQERV